MFGVKRCPECGSLLTKADLRCPGCRRAVNPAVGPPLLCEVCGAIKGENPQCERCNPPLQLSTAPASPTPAAPAKASPGFFSWATRSLRIQARPLLIGIFFSTVALFVGYQWGQVDREARDEEMLDQTRQMLLTQLDREREAFEAERDALIAAQSGETSGRIPAGLRWGQNPSSVRNSLSQKLHYLSEGATGSIYFQRYAGVFSNQPAEEVRPEFCNERLSGLQVTLSTAGTSIYRRWREVLEAIRESYGEPTSTHRPALAEAYESALAAAVSAHGGAAAADPQFTAQLGAIDQAITSGHEPLRARWELVDKASIELTARAASANPGAPLAVVWAFDKTDLSTACAAPTIPAATPHH